MWLVKVIAVCNLHSAVPGILGIVKKTDKQMFDRISPFLFPLMYKSNFKKLTSKGRKVWKQISMG